MLKRKTTVEYHSKIIDFLFHVPYCIVNCYLKRHRRARGPQARGAKACACVGSACARVERACARIERACSRAERACAHVERACASVERPVPAS